MNFDLHSGGITDCAAQTFDAMVLFQSSKVPQPGGSLGALLKELHLAGEPGKKAGKLLQLYRPADVASRRLLVASTGDAGPREMRQAAQAAGIPFVDFTNTMPIGTYIEQVERTKETKEADLIYCGIVLFGDWEKVSELTRKFSLWK